MIAAPLLHLHRLLVFYCYLGKISLITVEGVWLQNTLNAMERQLWSEAFGWDGNPTISMYHILNQNPSFLIGLRRTIIMVMLSTAFLAVVISQLGQLWARWVGIMTIIELILRAIMHFVWLHLPKTRIGKRLWKGVQERWPALLPMMMRLTEDFMYHDQERKPFRPSIDLDFA